MNGHCIRYARFISDKAISGEQSAEETQSNPSMSDNMNHMYHTTTNRSVLEEKQPIGENRKIETPTVALSENGSATFGEIYYINDKNLFYKICSVESLKTA